MATGPETSTDCLFSSASLRTVKVANKRESQRLATRLQSLNNETQLKMTNMNFCAKKTNEKLVKMRKEIGEKLEQKPEETTTPKDQDDYHNEQVANLFRDDNDPVSSIKQLISYAMEQFELGKEETQKATADQDDLNHVSITDEQLNQSAELAPVVHTAETDPTQSSGRKEVTCEDIATADPEIMTVQELKELIAHMYGSEESGFNLDSFTECLLPILRKTEVKTNEPQLSKSNDKLILLKEILSSEFPETYVQHEKGKRFFPLTKDISSSEFMKDCYKLISFHIICSNG